MVSVSELAWLVGASYKAGQMRLRFFAAQDLELIEWVDRFQPYCLAKLEQGESVKKVDLFTGNELQLWKCAIP